MNRFRVLWFYTLRNRLHDCFIFLY